MLRFVPYRGGIYSFEENHVHYSEVLKHLHMAVYDKLKICRLTPADPVSIMDVDDCAHKVTSSLPLFPEDIQSFPCMLLMRTENKLHMSLCQKNKHHLQCLLCEAGLHQLITMSQ